MKAGPDDERTGHSAHSASQRASLLTDATVASRPSGDILIGSCCVHVGQCCVGFVPNTRLPTDATEPVRGGQRVSGSFKTCRELSFRRWRPWNKLPVAQSTPVNQVKPHSHSHHQRRLIQPSITYCSNVRCESSRFLPAYDSFWSAGMMPPASYDMGG